MSDSWSIYIIVLAVGNILAMVWLLIATNKSNDIDEADTTGHQWDGIEELNNPLPRRWLGLFIITIIFAVIYLYLYPGLGSYQGSLGWSQTGAYNQEKQLNDEAQARYFADFSDLSVEQLSANSIAMETGSRLFANNCSTCHGSDGRGAKGFPNLTDNDWLYGADSKSIVASITAGRAGAMPKLPGIKVALLARYVQHLSGVEGISNHVIESGPSQFGICAGCHGADGKGNQLIGAPNLTDNVWLYGSRISDIEYVLQNGKQGNMPSFANALNANEINLLAAYVMSLSQNDDKNNASSTHNEKSHDKKGHDKKSIH